MKKIETIYNEKNGDMDTPGQYITDYLHETGDISETFNEIADNATPVYIGGLLEWYSDNFGEVAQYVDDEIAYNGATNIFGALSGGFYTWQSDKLYENKAEIIELWAWGYLFKIAKIDEITDEQAEAIEALEFGNYDSFDDLINDLDEIINTDDE